MNSINRTLIILSLFLCFIAVQVYGENSNPATIATNSTQAAGELLKRLLPDHAHYFIFEHIADDKGRDVFEIENRADKIVLRGNNAVSMASALNWYLKYHCFCDVSLFGNQLNLPDPLPVVPEKIRQTSQDKYRYMLNYCSFGYSLVWYDWPQWEKLIDWMALNGVNMPLAVTGQEAVWQNVGTRLGIDDLTDFLAGPPYLPFGWMGCLDGWGGPLPQSWIDSHLELQKQILARERELGMTPVLQGFTGHIPPAVLEKYPDSRAQKIEWIEWQTWMLDPLDPLFQKIAHIFIEEQTKLFGTDHLYAADSFIEMTPPSGDLNYLGRLSNAILDGMKGVDDQAVWVLQGWTFLNQKKFWTPERLDAFLSAISNEHILLLDLFCESNEMWRVTNSFSGKPWLWCNIQTFGATNHMHGQLNHINRTLSAARTHPQKGELCGIGFVNEGLEGNPVIYEFLLEQTWHNGPVDLNDWLTSYVISRYGEKNKHALEAWNLMLETVYSDLGPNDPFFSAIRYPRLDYKQAPNYDQQKVVAAWRALLKAAPAFKELETFQYDLAALGIHALSLECRETHEKMTKAFSTGDQQNFKAYFQRFLQLLENMEKLAASHPDFLLGRWLSDAKRWGATKPEQDLFEWNARKVLTLWGETDMLRDYSRRAWSGMFSSFYLPRWTMFIDEMQKSLDTGNTFDEKSVTEKLVLWELSWAEKKDTFPTKPNGQTINLSKNILEKYFHSRAK